MHDHSVCCVKTVSKTEVNNVVNADCAPLSELISSELIPNSEVLKSASKLATLNVLDSFQYQFENSTPDEELDPPEDPPEPPEPPPEVLPEETTSES